MGHTAFSRNTVVGIILNDNERSNGVHPSRSVMRSRVSLAQIGLRVGSRRRHLQSGRRLIENRPCQLQRPSRGNARGFGQLSGGFKIAQPAIYGISKFVQYVISCSINYLRHYPDDHLERSDAIVLKFKKVVPDHWPLS